MISEKMVKKNLAASQFLKLISLLHFCDYQRDIL